MQAVDSIFNGTSPGRRFARQRVSDRVRARLSARALDRALAQGVSPDASPTLGLRARALSEPAVRGELGQQLRRIVTQAHQPISLGTRVHPRRAPVLAAEDDLRLLAGRLQSSQRARVAGIAKVRVLLTDGSGPLYYRHSDQDLGTAIREATAALR
jgi:hypothetical protein